MALLDDVKTACRVTSTAFDGELTNLMSSALDDMGITDIKPDLLVATTAAEPLIKQALITYCKMNFGFQRDDYYARLKASYDEQKAQLSMSSAYANWGDTNA